MSPLSNSSTFVKKHQISLSILSLLICSAKTMSDQLALDISQANLSSFSFQISRMQNETSGEQEYFLVSVVTWLGLGTENNKLEMKLVQDRHGLFSGNINFPKNSIKILYYEAKEPAIREKIRELLDHRMKGNQRLKPYEALQALSGFFIRGDLKKTVEVSPTMNPEIEFFKKDEATGFLQVISLFNFEAKNKKESFRMEYNLNINQESKGKKSVFEFISFPRVEGIFLDKEIISFDVDEVQGFLGMLDIDMTNPDEIPTNTAFGEEEEEEKVSEP